MAVGLRWAFVDGQPNASVAEASSSQWGLAAASILTDCKMYNDQLGGCVDADVDSETRCGRRDREDRERRGRSCAKST